MNAPMPTALATPASLEGRVAVVTGSTSGIGLGIARALAAAGASVMLNGFGTPEAIDAALGSVPGADYSAADMTDPVAILGMIAATQTRFGRLDILVNNAGIQHVAPVADFPPDKWDAVLAINLSSAFHTIRAALPQMRAQGFGRIVGEAVNHHIGARRRHRARNPQPDPGI